MTWELHLSVLLLCLRIKLCPTERASVVSYYHHPTNPKTGSAQTSVGKIHDREMSEKTYGEKYARKVFFAVQNQNMSW